MGFGLGVSAVASILRLKEITVIRPVRIEAPPDAPAPVEPTVAVEPAANATRYRLLDSVRSFANRRAFNFYTARVVYSRIKKLVFQPLQ